MQYLYLAAVLLLTSLNCQAEDEHVFRIIRRVNSYQLWREYKTDIQSIEQRIQQIGQSDVRSISQSLWVLDSNSIQLQTDGLLSLPDMQYLSVTDTGNKEITHSGVRADEDIITVNFPLEYSYRGDLQLLGNLTIQASLTGVYQRLINEAILILITQAIKTFFVTIFILLIVQRVITRHLTKIAAHAEKINLDNESPILQLDRNTTYSTRRDELERLVNAMTR